VGIQDLLVFVAVLFGSQVFVKLAVAFARSTSGEQASTARHSRGYTNIRRLKGWRKLGRDLLAICRDARKGRSTGSHWSKPVATPLHSTNFNHAKNMQRLFVSLAVMWLGFPNSGLTQQEDNKWGPWIKMTDCDCQGVSFYYSVPNKLAPGEHDKIRIKLFNNNSYAVGVWTDMVLTLSNGGQQGGQPLDCIGVGRLNAGREYVIDHEAAPGVSFVGANQPPYFISWSVNRIRVLNLDFVPPGPPVYRSIPIDGDACDGSRGTTFGTNRIASQELAAVLAQVGNPWVFYVGQERETVVWGNDDVTYTYGGQPNDPAVLKYDDVAKLSLGSVQDSHGNSIIKFGGATIIGSDASVRCVTLLIDYYTLNFPTRADAQKFQRILQLKIAARSPGQSVEQAPAQAPEQAPLHRNLVNPQPAARTSPLARGVIDDLLSSGRKSGRQGPPKPAQAAKVTADVPVVGYGPPRKTADTKSPSDKIMDGLLSGGHGPKGSTTNSASSVSIGGVAKLHGTPLTPLKPKSPSDQVMGNYSGPNCGVSVG
jgi:hypothetical protein